MPFLRLLARVDNFYIDLKQENAGRIWYQDVIQLLQRQNELSRFQTVPIPSIFEVLQKTPNPFHNSM